MSVTRITKTILFCGQVATVACDGNCSKAWGMNNRPKFFPADARCEDDDYGYLADGELGTAPEDPGTYEGDEGKVPLSMNKWCVRECERHVLSEPGKSDEKLQLKDFSKRVWNYADRRPDGTIDTEYVHRKGL